MFLTTKGTEDSFKSEMYPIQTIKRVTYKQQSIKCTSLNSNAEWFPMVHLPSFCETELST